jgi:hypothetical protein
MNKLVINTQYMENYGCAKDPYMKFKGGNTFVLPNCGELDSNEIATIVAKVRPFITTTMAESNGGCEEYIIDSTVVPHSEKVCEDWETITEFCFDQFSGDVNFMKVSDNREDGWMRDEILEQTETWTGDMSATVKRADYKSEYLMEDGDFALGQQGLKEWFTAREVA